MSKHLIIADSDPEEQAQLYVLAPSIRPGILWVDMDDTTEDETRGIALAMDRRGATALRDFLTEWLDSLDATG